MAFVRVYNGFMRITIPDAAKPFLEKEMAKAGYEDASEYVLSLIKQRRQKVRRDEIEQMLLEAIDSPSSPMTRKDWDDIRRIGRRMLAQRKSK